MQLGELEAVWVEEALGVGVGEVQLAEVTADPVSVAWRRRTGLDVPGGDKAGAVASDDFGAVRQCASWSAGKRANERRTLEEEVGAVRDGHFTVELHGRRRIVRSRRRDALGRRDEAALLGQEEVDVAAGLDASVSTGPLTAATHVQSSPIEITCGGSTESAG